MSAQALGLSNGERSPVALLVNLIESPRSSTLVRSEAYVALGRLGDAAALGTVLRGVVDAPGRDRIGAVIAAGLVASDGDLEAVRRLAWVLDHGGDTAVQSQAAIALGRVGGELARKVLLTKLADNDDYLRPWAALGLGILSREKEGGDPSVQEILRSELLREKTASIRGALAIATGIAKDREAARELLSIWRHKGDPGTRGYAALALAMIGARDTAEELERTIERDQDPRLLREVTLSLGLMGQDSSQSAMIRLLRESGNVNVQAGAAVALGTLGLRVAARPLLEMLAEPETTDSTRAALLASLGFLFDSEPVPMLSRVTRDANYFFPTPAFQELMHFQL